MFGANGKCIKQSKASRAPDSISTLAAVVHHYLMFNLVHAVIELLFFFKKKAFLHLNHTRQVNNKKL